MTEKELMKITVGGQTVWQGWTESGPGPWARSSDEDDDPFCPRCRKPWRPMTLEDGWLECACGFKPAKVGRCGARGFAAPGDIGCIRKKGHRGGHGYSDGSGEQDDPLERYVELTAYPTLADAEEFMRPVGGRWVPQGIRDLIMTEYGRMQNDIVELHGQVKNRNSDDVQLRRELSDTKRDLATSREQCDRALAAGEKAVEHREALISERDGLRANNRVLRADVERLRGRTHEIQAEEMQKRKHLDSELDMWRNRWKYAEEWTQREGLRAEWAAEGFKHTPFWSMTSEHARCSLMRLITERDEARAELEEFRAPDPYGGLSMCAGDMRAEILRLRDQLSRVRGFIHSD